MRIVRLAVALCLAAAAGGCAASRGARETLIFSGRHRTWTFRNHVKDVADPFGAGGPVMAGEPGSGEAEPSANKMTFVNDEGGFGKIPADGRVQLALRAAVRRLRKLRIVVIGKDPPGSKSYRVEVPTEAAWCDVAVPLNLQRNKPGSTIEDVTIFQLGRSPGAELYLDRVSLRVEGKTEESR